MQSTPTCQSAKATQTTTDSTDTTGICPRQQAMESAPCTALADLCAQAHYQIEAMAFALQKAARATDTDALPYLVQSIAIRIVELNTALMNITNGDSTGQDALNSLGTTVFGTMQEVAA